MEQEELQKLVKSEHARVDAESAAAEGTTADKKTKKKPGKSDKWQSHEVLVAVLLCSVHGLLPKNWCLFSWHSRNYRCYAVAL